MDNVTKRARELRKGDRVTVTGNPLLVDVIMSVEHVNTPFGWRVWVRLDNGDRGYFKQTKIVRTYDE